MTLPWMDASWALGTAAECGILLCCRSLFPRWRAVLLYCLLSVGTSAALFLIQAQPRSHTRYVEYFWTFWAWKLASPLTRVLVLGDVAASLPGTLYLRRRVRHAVTLGALACALATGALSWTDGTSIVPRITASVLTLERCSTFAWTAFLVVVVSAVLLRRMRWSREGAFVLAGLCIRAAFGMPAAYLFSLAPGHEQLASAACSVGALLCSLVWLYVFALPALPGELVPIAAQ